MAVLSIPDQNYQSADSQEIRNFLQSRGIHFDQWEAQVDFEDNASQDTILGAYAHVLKPYMEANGYQVADVININSETPNYEAVRQKFLAEHIHTEDEVRFFVDGEGLFWFHLEDEPIFNVLCQAGDLISVPTGAKHWFDAGEKDPFVKVIRIFIDPSGWVPHYTDSGISEQYV